MNTRVVRSGNVSFKEDGLSLAGFLWRPRWLVLKEQSLLVHKNEVSLVARQGVLSGITIRFLTAQSHFRPI